LQLELAAMFRNGDLQNMWEVARQTHLTFNMVRAAGRGRQAGWLAGCAGVLMGGWGLCWETSHQAAGLGKAQPPTPPLPRH
jgi:hypothetical protein